MVRAKKHRKPSLHVRVRRFLRPARAQARFLALLLREFWFTLATFLVLIGLGGYLFHRYQLVDGTPVSYVEGIYATFALIFFQSNYPFPAVWRLRLIYFVVPIVGLALLAEGLGRFLSLIVSKDSRMEDWQMALASTYSDHIVIYGLGRIGYRVARQLHLAGERLVAIEKNGANQFIEQVRSLGIPVVINDPSQERALESAGIGRARTIIIVTDDDLANLEMALDARDMNPGIRVVLRMFNERLVEKVKKAFNIDTVFSTSLLAAPVFAASSVTSAVKRSFYVDETLLEIAEITLQAGSKLVGKTLLELRRSYPLRVVSLRRGKTPALFPEETLVLTAGDAVVVLCSLETVQRLEEASSGE